SIGEKGRHGWFKRYTDAVRAFTHLLKERELKMIEQRLDLIEAYRKKTALTNPRPTTNEDSSRPGGSQA
ncbi:MAG TPA: hypothetical protein VE955_06265, partial [Candidatus Dormibacteraeota bacterium]|nr:hypothetical protein [Candidatus Dormibacteraeota bacterium]